MYYKLGQACVTNWGSFVLLQIRANIVTNWGSFIIKNWHSYYKLGQLLLQNRAAITNWSRYYKLGQLLQIGAQQYLWRALGIQMSQSFGVNGGLIGPVMFYFRQIYKNVNTDSVQFNNEAERALMQQPIEALWSVSKVKSFIYTATVLTS